MTGTITTHNCRWREQPPEGVAGLQSFGPMSPTCVGGCLAMRWAVPTGVGHWNFQRSRL
jgi:hypothetical protein